jgi:hypothetical protein
LPPQATPDATPGHPRRPSTVKFATPDRGTTVASASAAMDRAPAASPRRLKRRESTAKAKQNEREKDEDAYKSKRAEQERKRVKRRKEEREAAAAAAAAEAMSQMGAPVEVPTAHAVPLPSNPQQASSWSFGWPFGHGNRTPPQPQPPPQPPPQLPQQADAVTQTRRPLSVTFSGGAGEHDEDHRLYVSDVHEILGVRLIDPQVLSRRERSSPLDARYECLDVLVRADFRSLDDPNGGVVKTDTRWVHHEDLYPISRDPDDPEDLGDDDEEQQLLEQWNQRAVAFNELDARVRRQLEPFVPRLRSATDGTVDSGTSGGAPVDTSTVGSSAMGSASGGVGHDGTAGGNGRPRAAGKRRAPPDPVPSPLRTRRTRVSHDAGSSSVPCCGACHAAIDMSGAWHRCKLGCEDQFHDQPLHSWVACDQVWMPVEGEYFCGRTCISQYNAKLRKRGIRASSESVDGVLQSAWLLPVQARPV